MRTLLCASALFAALTASAAQAQTLVFCSEGEPEAISPHIVTTTTGMNAARPIFDNLVDTRVGGTEVVPGLAHSWTISSDGLEYVFQLRSDVRFHANDRFKPTRTMNADDVVFSLNRQLRPEHPFHAIPGASYAYFVDTGMPDLLTSVEKVDEYTVKMTLARPEAPFLSNLALPLSGVMSAEYADQLLAEGRPELLDTQPVGTGPFRFVAHQPNLAIRYRAFDKHWRGAPDIDTLVYSITPNPSVRLTKLKAGECHLMALADPGDAEQIAADPALELLKQEGYNVGYLAMNTTRPPFDDVRVRRAVAMAIDKDAIVKAVYQGAGVKAVNPLPPTSWAYNADVQDHPYDPEAAWALLLEAGLGEGFDTDLWYMPVSRPYNPDGKRIAEMIAADLAQVGIRATLKTKEWGAYRDSLQRGEHMMALYGWTGDNGDPDNFLNVLLGCRSAKVDGNNIAKWCHPGYDRLVTEAARQTDQSIRADFYRQAQVIARDEAPWVPLAHSVVLMAKRRSVQNFTIDPLDRHLFGNVRLAEGS